MSTFDGYVKEFPTIRIDYFRADSSRPNPAACFLSHVHSDHLLGLESLKTSFVYCSATTRRLLLRMEKYPHRINFQKGILEARKQTWKHLKKHLRVLPLQTPTVIELSPKLSIRVTLIDANHCPGAVMFLIESDSNAILYTGDVRAEPWWVTSIVQIPLLLPYSCGLKRLDCIYLDTTFASHNDKYRHFQTKAEGLRELMTKVQKHHTDTLAKTGKAPKFYLRAWTLGYEQVWMTLANLLQSKVHVDEYQLRLFDTRSDDMGMRCEDEGKHYRLGARAGYSTFEGPSLVGFDMGNDVQEGLLTQDTDSHIHSCEPGMPCHSHLLQNEVIWITPIISRLPDGTELYEVGAGGGLGDLYQRSELEMTQDLDMIAAELIQNPDALAAFRKALQGAKDAGALSLSLEGLGLDSDAEVSLKEFVRLLSTSKEWTGKQCPAEQTNPKKKRGTVITFPFSRHSSLDELRHLVQSFRPKDLCACTVDAETWSEECSMRNLFGDLCSEQIFEHDAEVREDVARYRLQKEQKGLKRKRGDASPQRSSQASPQVPSFRSAHSYPSKEVANGTEPDVAGTSAVNAEIEEAAPDDDETQSASEVSDMDARVTAIRNEFDKKSGGTELIVIEDDTSVVSVGDDDADGGSQASLATSAFASQPNNYFSALRREEGINDEGHQIRSRVKSSHARRDAYEQARRSLRESSSGPWDDLNLRSIGAKGHSEAETEL